jgi:uncharacterized membrane protein YhaH (DUF805 family)
MTKYFSFKGLAKRQEYWAIMLIAFALTFVTTLFTEALVLINTDGAIIGLLFLIAAIVALVWLQFATAARRCRDAGISPWWVVVFVIPYINLVATVVFGVLKTADAGDDDA